jgi:hypothetical protein
LIWQLGQEKNWAKEKIGPSKVNLQIQVNSCKFTRF